MLPVFIYAPQLELIKMANIMYRKDLQIRAFSALFLSFLIGSCKKESKLPVPTDLALTIQKIGALDSTINECSGFFYADEQLFIINDGGGGPLLHQVNPTNLSQTEQIQLLDVSNTDWEAIVKTEEEIIIGDFGNNFGNRRNLSLMHFDSKTYLFKREITFSFPNQFDYLPSDSHNFDCEALFVKDEQYHIFTKNRGNNKTNLYTAPINTALFELKDSLEVPAFITDAYYYEAKQVILLLGNQFVLDSFESFISIIHIQEDATVDLLASLALDIKEQVEAITLKEDNVFFIGSEKESNNGGNLYEVRIDGL